MNDQRPGMELGLGALAAACGISLVLWWGIYLAVRWIAW